MYDLYIASCVPEGGIYHYKMDNDGKALLCKKTDMNQPMFLAKEKNRMYALAREAFEDGTSGLVSFDIDGNGDLINESKALTTQGKVACHLCIDNGIVYAVNYVSGSVIKMPEGILREHSGHGTDAKRQDKPHTHYTAVTPDNKYVCVTDLGLDTIFFYNKNLELQFKVRVPDGHGARHVAFSDDGKIMYCVNELKSTVSVFRYEEADTVLLHTYEALPSDFNGMNLAAAIRIKENYLYISNRGYDGVTSFKINGEELEIVGYTKVGVHPRDINIFGDILISTNMYDDTVAFYKISEGILTECNIIKGIKEPLCII